MGTNFYALRVDDGVCSHCHGTGKATVHTHIGKSSGGWTFGFHAASTYDLHPDFTGGDETISSYAEWLAYLETPGIKIFNEYDEEVSLEDFKALVEAKKTEAHNHTLYIREDPQYKGTRYADDCFLDPEGHSFSKGEFS